MTPSLTAMAVGSRAAAVVIALGYLLGIVEADLIALIGALALLTFGRMLESPWADSLRLCGGFALIVLGLGVAGTRWETLELTELRGVQAVVGPTIVTGDPVVVTGAVLASIAGSLGLALWASGVRRMDVSGAVELGVWGLALATAFWGPDPGWGTTGARPEIALQWALVAVVAASVAGVIGVFARSRVAATAVAAGLGILALAVGAALIGLG